MGKKVGKFELVNDEKIDRAINGSTGNKGQLLGGLLSKLELNDPDEIPEAELLAEYDKLGGAILQDGSKVKNGSFYDFRKKKPFEEPEIIFVERIDGQEVELDEAEAKTIKSARKKIADAKKRKAKK